MYHEGSESDFSTIHIKALQVEKLTGKLTQNQ